jgi:hypothetical protein
MARNGGDLEQCRMLLEASCLSPEKRRDVCERALAETMRIVTEYWLPLTVLAERLYVHRFLDETQIRAAIRSAGNYGAELLGLPTPAGHRGVPPPESEATKAPEESVAAPPARKQPTVGARPPAHRAVQTRAAPYGITEDGEPRAYPPGGHPLGLLRRQ